MDTIEIHTTTDKMHECESGCIYVVVNNTNGDMRNVAYCTTRDMANEMRDMYCEDVLGIDSESEGKRLYFHREIQYRLSYLLLIVFRLWR